MLLLLLHSVHKKHFPSINETMNSKSTMEPPASEAPKAAANAKCKKPSRPKRPLSAYNLFYRFKRQKMIDGIAMGKTDRTSITLLIEAAPGLEFYPPGATEGAPPDLVWDLRRRNIRHVMNHNLLPRDTRDRSHRKNRDAMNGAVGFLELGRMMNAKYIVDYGTVHPT